MKVKDAVTYSVVFKNNSLNADHVFMYQTSPDIKDPNIMSLAWFSQYSYPTTENAFEWDISYNFVWAQTGTLNAGVRFKAAQTWDADPKNLNTVSLDYDRAYNFQNLCSGGTAGSLYINESGSIPMKQASVGIGMSGSGTFVKQAQPNMHLVFTPHPVYYIAFGDHQQGEVLDINQITDSAKIDFPVNTYSMTAILNADNTWTIESTDAVNEKFSQNNGRVRWGSTK
jgi:rhizosphere induced protein